jgi:hypothetical protein
MEDLPMLPRLVHRLAFVLLLSALISRGASFAQPAAPAAAPAQTGASVFLPLLRVAGTADPTPDPGPYAQLLARAAAACPQVAPNTACYVGGPVTLEAAAGAQRPTTPGATFDLAGVSRLRLTAPTADSAAWGVVRLRLHADAALDVLAFGNVTLEIVRLAEQPAQTPELHLRTAATPGSNGRYSSGMVISGPAAELGAVALNDAQITLSGAVYAAADQPAGSAAAPAANDDLFVPLTVATTEGVAQVEAGATGQTVHAGRQTSVPLDANGQAAGAPSTPVDARLIDYIFDLLVPLTPEGRQQLADAAISRFDAALDRCIAGRVTAIYSVLFWRYVIVGDSYLADRIDPARLAAAQARIPKCLAFELEFASDTTTSGGPVTEQSFIRADRIPLRFNADGGLQPGAAVGLRHTDHVYTSPEPCAISWVTLDGTVRATQGSLRVAFNRIDVDLRLGVERAPTSEVVMNCPMVPPITLSQDQWWTVFPHLHRAIWQPGEVHTFRFREWHYTAGSASCSGVPAAQCPHVAESVYQLEETNSAITMSVDTHLTLVHTPQR